MPENLTRKIIAAHLVSGEMEPGKEIALRIDQTLTQDSTGTMAYLQFEAMGIGQVRTRRSIAYIDHNTLQAGYENADDHQYIQTVAHKHGIYCSKPGNGICHQVHLERFGVPGWTLLGSDSHTPTCGGLGMLAIGAGGLDVAVAMGGGAYYLPMPRVTCVRLTGALRYGVAAKDIILEILRRLSVKGGVGGVMEYSGDGVATLSVPERATIANMGAELGATSSVFPSDDATREFLRAQGRGDDFSPWEADAGCGYDETLTVDLSALAPLAACPHMPDNVAPLAEVGPIRVDQVCVGSCTNSSYLDMMRVAAILRGRAAHPDVSLVIAPGSKQVLTMLAKNGALADMIAAGARILEAACGPCIGMGQAPRTGAVSVRTNNRNFYGRSGTDSAQVYLTSCETAAATALTGVLTDPRSVSADLSVEMPERFEVNDHLIVPPAAEPDSVTVVRGPNIQPFPVNVELPSAVSGEVLLKMEDNVTTDHIMPSNAKLLPFRSNVPYLAEYCLTPIDAGFPSRAKAAGGGFLVAGHNYGQGSSREHAALAPLQLGIRVVVAKSFARIHQANLLNSGILPLTFAREEDYDRIRQGDLLVLPHARSQIAGGDSLILRDDTTGFEFVAKLALSGRLRDIVLAGGLINYTKLSGTGRQQDGEGARP